MMRRTVRASGCIALVAFGWLAGCAAQADGVGDTDEAVTDGPRKGGGSECGGAICASHLPEDPAIACYRNVSAPVVDSLGVVHNEKLNVQLAMAAGLQYAQLQPAGTNVCASPSYDCAGVFYDGAGRPSHVPTVLTTVRTDEDLKRAKATVGAFYDAAYTDARARNKLAPGKAKLCTTWAEVSFQTHPDPSILQAYAMLQAIGAESTLHQDRTWMKNILAAGTVHGCPTPAIPPTNDEESWFVPMQSARDFHKAFHDCHRLDKSGIGGCPHSFDVPMGLGNFVNDLHILDAAICGMQASWFAGDPSGGCGASCYVRKTL
jgi:hypothetical protein